MMSCKRIRSATGFTLIEVVVAISILAGLTLLTTQAIQNGINSRNQVSRQISADSLVRDTLRVMERDINLAFHHRDIFTTMMNEIEKEQAQAAAKKSAAAAGKSGAKTGTPATPAAEAHAEQRKPPTQLTAFYGTTEAIHFTSLSNVRMQRDLQESDQAEVGYFLKTCRSRTAQRSGRRAAPTSQCLVRRLSPLIDDDVTQGGSEVVLIEHVEEFNLRYFGPERDDWVSEWKTGANGDAISKENFPYAVEISLAVHNKEDPKAKKISMTMVAPLRFPNNPPKKNAGAANAPSI